MANRGQLADSQQQIGSGGLTKDRNIGLESGARKRDVIDRGVSANQVDIEFPMQTVGVEIDRIRPNGCGSNIEIKPIGGDGSLDQEAAVIGVRYQYIAE